MNETSTVLPTTRPELHPSVRIGPGLWEGDRLLYTLHDSRTRWYFRIREHEHFLVSRMDGERTVEEIESAFIEHYRKRLSPALWRSLFELLGRRGLLVGTDTPVLLERLRDARTSQLDRSRTWLHARLPLVRPERLLNALAGLVRPLDRPSVWVMTWLAAAGAIAYTVFGWSEVIPQALTLWNSAPSAIIFIIFMWTSMALHELGHGVMAKLYGARDIEIGLMWRLPMIAAYCKVDDVLLFHDRGRRVRVALAGVTVSVATCAPFALVHWWTGGQGTWGTVSAAVLTFGMLFGLINLLPVFRLDGYYVLSHGLGVSALDESARLELVRLVRPRSRSNSVNVKSHLYLAYGIGAYLFQTVLVVGIAFLVHSGISPYVGGVTAVVLIALTIVVIGAVGVTFARRSKKKIAALPGTVAPGDSRWGNT